MRILSGGLLLLPPRHYGAGGVSHNFLFGGGREEPQSQFSLWGRVGGVSVTIFCLGDVCEELQSQFSLWGRAGGASVTIFSLGEGGWGALVTIFSLGDSRGLESGSSFF